MRCNSKWSVRPGMMVWSSGKCRGYPHGFSPSAPAPTAPIRRREYRDLHVPDRWITGRSPPCLRWRGAVDCGGRKGMAGRRRATSRRRDWCRRSFRRADAFLCARGLHSVFQYTGAVACPISSWRRHRLESWRIWCSLPGAGRRIKRCASRQFRFRGALKSSHGRPFSEIQSKTGHAKTDEG